MFSLEIAARNPHPRRSSGWVKRQDHDKTTTMPPRCSSLLAALLGIGCSALLGCQPPPDLIVQHDNVLPIRVAQASDGRFYVSDAQSGSIFIYDANLLLEQELKHLDRPLGVAVDAKRRIYVGSDGHDGIEVYDSEGSWIRDIGKGMIRMPTDIALGARRRLFVADSLSDTVWVYTKRGRLVRRIGASGSGPGELSFPVAVTVAKRHGRREVYVADQGNARIQVFAPDGTFLRSFGSKVPQFSSAWQGRFVKIQSLAMDADGHLHVLDSYMHVVQVFDPAPGVAEADRFLRYYGVHGSDPGELNLPLDLVISKAGEAIVTNSGNKTVETISQEVGS